MMTLLAQLPDPKGAESVGWIMLTIGGIIIIVAAGLACAAYIKQLRASKVVQQQIMTQPFIVAMEKEFVARHEYERRNKDMAEQVIDRRREIKDVQAFTHEESHKIRESLNAISLEMGQRSERLSALEADSKTFTRQLDSLNVKVDRIVDRVADKVEKLLEKRGPVQ